MSEDIYNLLAKHFTGQTSEAEAADIRQWLNASAQNEADYRLLEKLWHQSAEQEPIDFDTELALQTVSAQLQPAKTGWIITLGRAAAIAAALLIGLLIWELFNANRMRIVAADTAVKEVKLEDGSRVYLRQGAALHYPAHFTNSKRAVALTGEAFFSVVRNTASPFIVNAGPAHVTVLGTSFSVINANDSVQLIVKTGLVKFNAAHDTASKLLVSAGEKAVYGQNRLQKAMNTDVNFNAWQSKQLVFKNTPLQQVMATLSNYYQVNMILNRQDSAQLAGTTITVTFNDQPLTKVLQELSLITSFNIKEESNRQYIISAR
ncbi:FecR family protein [Longitalea arenae]|uniref:FecR family protein n=1 Tax=Longitalea arenae TaxID=2812558 RepID=UPI001968273B|nr:FecR family protein [Longitalea arenae]